MNPFADHNSFRQELLRGWSRQVFGPGLDAPLEELAEIIQISPLQLYATGVLFPQKMRHEQLEDSSDAPTPEETRIVDGELEPPLELEEGGRHARDATEASGSAEREPLNLANEFSPSACGISFRVKGAVRLEFEVIYGTYASAKRSEPHPRAGAIGSDGKPFPKEREATVYRRTHHQQTICAEIPDRPGRIPPILLGEEAGLRLHITVRQRRDRTNVVSAMVVNHKVAGPEVGPSVEDTYFQVAIAVRSAEANECVFLPIDREVGDTGGDDEFQALDLLYRHRRAFALGHGTAADWNRDEILSERGETDRVRSLAIPTYELKPIRARERAFRQASELELSMKFLFDGGDSSQPDDAILAALRLLADDYDAWIRAKEAESTQLPETLLRPAEVNLATCRQCHSRMVRGIDYLAGDKKAMLSFRLMNKAMLIQQLRSSLPLRQVGAPHPIVSVDSEAATLRRWRPFQLAFILMNIVSMSVPTDPERALVDLIWFPTGGGKTEAYLGLAAFSICFERMSGSPPGTTVLMRYTLRLLTSQQFQRAAALVLALETLRLDRELGANLGISEISIGLWVGQSLSPNSRDQARAALKRMKQQDKAKQNPFQLLRCPWCGLRLDDSNALGYRDAVVSGTSERTVKFVCPDAECRFGEHSHGLPVLVVDEDIYHLPPTILIGTVDKFAQIAWEDRVGRLFGIGTGAPPPALIIQDELHLISGPLGTIVGLYETAIDRLCSRDGRTQKIVASTATIRRAHQQCRDLYARQSFEFPPQAIRAGDSYFAYEDADSAGRLYVGFMGNAVKSHQTALVRACSPLLQGACYPIDETDDEKRSIINPYGTLVWYFNSLRELGHAATLCAGDIPEFLKGLCHRLQIPYENRRYLREVVEMTSRCNADEIPSILQQLEIPWQKKPQGAPPVDILLSTNMIAVGVDVGRLGLMVVSGQPKGTSEYIQATSRVGRFYPGLVVTVYTQTKSRDRSHYERFVAYHQSLYRFVEPTSVTPFSPQARERGMRGVLIALARLRSGITSPGDIEAHLSELQQEIEVIIERALAVDPDEVEEAREELNQWVRFWRAYAPSEYGKMGGVVSAETLVYPFGNVPDQRFQREAWPMLTSMRNVDGTSSARVLNVYDAATT